MLALYNIQSTMNKKIRILFAAQQKDYSIEAPFYLDYKRFLEVIEGEMRTYLSPRRPEKAYIRMEVQGQKYPKYLKLSKEAEVDHYIRKRGQKEIVVQFFYSRKEQTIRQSFIKFGKMLQNRQKQLRVLTNELKEVNQIDVLKFIINKSSREQEEVIEVFFVVCDPLVETEKEQGILVHYPLYHVEIDMPSHLERLRKASLSNGDFKIKAKRIWGNQEQLDQCLKHGTEGNKQVKLFAVIQIFTRVERKDGVLMMSLQGSGAKIGERVWISAQSFFKKTIYANIVIIVGVGVNQLKELAKNLDFQRPLFLISTISLQDKITCDRPPNEKQAPYTDKYCQLFLQSFYSNLFRRYEVKKCYQMAMKDLSQPSIKQNLWCCCLHNHDEGCSWPNIARRVGELELHRLLKHDDFLTRQQYRKKLQEFLLDSSLEPCTSDESLCCWRKVEANSKFKTYHERIDETILWNEREPDEVYEKLQLEKERPNRFQSDTYEKPTARRKPLTVYRVMHHILKGPICVLRAPILSQIKRYFFLAKEYLQARNPCLFFQQIDTTSLHQKQNFKKRITQLIKQNNNKQVPLGASAGSRRKQWIFMVQYSHQNSKKYYETIVRDFVQVKKYFTREANLKLVILADNLQSLKIKISEILAGIDQKKGPKQQKIEDPFDIDGNDPLQQYYTILSKHAVEQVIHDLHKRRQEIKAGEDLDNQKKEKELEGLEKEEYQFLGFLSQFSEDGFYLNKVSHIILNQLFGREIVTSVKEGKLEAVQNINLSDSVYFLQLKKAYHKHFTNSQNYLRLAFQEKKLEFYFLLLRIYFQFWPKTGVVTYPEVIRQYINKQGIFSIDIELERTDCKSDLEACLKEIEPNREEINNLLFDVDNLIHIYHLGQVQKILQEFLKKKRNRHNPITTKSKIEEGRLKKFQYLLWNIIMKAWLMSKVLSKKYQENVGRFRVVLIIFFVRAQIPLPISQVARIQMHVLMEQSLPKLQEYDFNNLNLFLKFYRNYAFRSMSLCALSPIWGNHNKCKDLFGNCLYLAQKIGWIIDSDKSKYSDKQKDYYIDFKILSQNQHKMFKGTSKEKWMREGLKIIEKKILYYFDFTTEMKKNRSLQDYNKNILAFQQHFKLGEISYELERYKANLPQGLQGEPETMLIDMYLRVILSEKEVDKTVLIELKGQISAEYMPLFSYLIQKVEQNTLFNQNRLIIFSRARNLVWYGQPYFYTRKRTLLTQYLGKVFHDKEVKVSYFPLTDKTFDLFYISKHNYKCQVLCMILTIDAFSEDQLMFGSESGVDTVKMSTEAFYEKIKRCRIKILILCGENSTKVCNKLKEMAREGRSAPCQSPMTHSLGQDNHPRMASSTIRLPMAVSSIRPTSEIKSSRSSIKDSSSSNTSALKTRYAQTFPTVIAIESEAFSLSDYKINMYQKNEQVPTQKKTNFPSTFNKAKIQGPISRVQQIKQEFQKQEQQITPGEFQDFEKIGQINKVYSKQSSEGVSEEISVTEEVGKNQFTTKLKDTNSEEYEQEYRNLLWNNRVEEYLANEVNNIGMDLIIMSIVKKIVNKVSFRDVILKEPFFQEIIKQSKEEVENILSHRFQCAQTVFQQIKHELWVNEHLISKVPKGRYEDLTKKFYSTENNLHDEDYYENIGHCLELHKVFKKLNHSKLNCIEIIGGFKGEKSNLLQQICWYAQTKGLFKFGIIKVDLKDGSLDPLMGRTYKNKDSHLNAQKNGPDLKKGDIGILIAFDNIDDDLKKYRGELQKLKGKYFTLIYTANKQQAADELRELLGMPSPISINLNSRLPEELKNLIYAHLLSHIKERKDQKLTKDILVAYQKRIDEIMKTIQKVSVEDKLTKAIEMLRGPNASGEDEKSEVFFNFYKRHFDELLVSLELIKEITLKII